MNCCDARKLVMAVMDSNDIEYDALSTGECTLSHTTFPLLHRCTRHNIKVEDIDREAHSRTRVWNVHDTSHMTLYRCAREQEVDLIIIVPYNTSQQASSQSDLVRRRAHHIVADTR